MVRVKIGAFSESFIEHLMTCFGVSYGSFLTLRRIRLSYGTRQLWIQNESKAVLKSADFPRVEIHRSRAALHPTFTKKRTFFDFAFVVTASAKQMPPAYFPAKWR